MDVSASSPEAVLTYAVTDEDAQAVWCKVPSRLSHIPNCIWVSMDGQWPYLLVDPVPHRDRVVPNMECKVYNYDTLTGVPDVDMWIRDHRALLDELLHEKVSERLLYSKLIADKP